MNQDFFFIRILKQAHIAQSIAKGMNKGNDCGILV